MVAEIGLGSGDVHGFTGRDRASMLAGGGENQHEQQGESRGQSQGEQTKTRVREIQGLLFRMNLHYKPEGRNGETIDRMVNRLRRWSNAAVNGCGRLLTIGNNVIG
jgi:uncharacterized protein YggL (DUF469 family)